MRISASWLAFSSLSGEVVMADDDEEEVGLVGVDLSLRLRLRGNGTDLGMCLSFMDGRRNVMV